MAFGGENIRNTVNVKIMTPKIHRIASDSERTFYFIEDGYDLPEDNIFTVIGKRKDGIWVKYFDSDSVAIKYFGKPNGVWQSNSLWFYEFNVQEDYIILKYAKYHKELRNQTTGFGAGYVKEGEFRFKWDDTAQWFGVEQVVY